MWLVDLNYIFECDWLIELSNNKLSDNNLGSELVENRTFKQITSEEIVIFMINWEKEIRKPMEPGRDLQPFFPQHKQMYGKWKEVPPVTHLAVLSSLSVTERAFLGCGLHCGSPIDLLPKPSL